MDPTSPPLKDFLGLAGVSLGPYVVTEIASLGGVALVYRGEHETLHNAVAVKVLTPEVATAEVRDTLEALFLREAQILSQLRSEHILRAHHHGRIACPADGRERPYLVVDWLEGETLSDELDRRRREKRPYTITEAVELLEPIALALDTAHAAGIIHRDVNPRNIFLETVPQGPPRAKLIDFGFAKDVAATRALQLERVHGTLLARSPDYAAPEHYDREKYGDLSENTDIYTFALTLVEMLTLHSPLRGATTEALAYATSNREDRPTPNNRGASVPHNVEQLFEQALAVDQFERPGSLLGWYRQVQQALRRPTTRPPPPSRSVPPKKPRRTGLWVVLGLLVLSGAAIGAFFATRPVKCAPGFADCNGERSDGCEVELATSPLHCGGCAHACDTTHGTVQCVSGACRIERCTDEARRDCNGTPGDGCEVDVSSDPQNCGACAKRCGSDGTTKVGCQAGKCELACVKGRGDCDQRAENGCEVALSSDVENCGRCGFGCKDSRCEDGYCVPKKLASLETPFELAVRGGRAYVWEAKSKRLRSVSSAGETVVAESVDALSALAATRGGLYWAASEPPRLFHSGDGADAGAPAAVAGPLAGPTPLVLDLDGGHLSFADRTPRAKKPPKRGVTTLAVGDTEQKPRSVQCPDWPARFAGDDKQLFCCDDAKQLASIACPSGKCATRRHPFPCPELLVLDTDTLYFFRGTRLFAMDRASGKATQIAKRVRPPRELVQDGAHLYWIEGTDQAAIFRLAKPERAKAAPEPPEAIAGKLHGARALSVDDVAIYWTVAEGAAGAQLLALQKPR